MVRNPAYDTPQGCKPTDIIRDLHHLLAADPKYTPHSRRTQLPVGFAVKEAKLVFRNLGAGKFEKVSEQPASRWGRERRWNLWKSSGPVVS